MSIYKLIFSLSCQGASFIGIAQPLLDWSSLFYLLEDFHFIGVSTFRTRPYHPLNQTLGI